MKKSKIILIAIYIIAAAAVLYFAYGVVKKRYMSPNQQNAQTQNSEAQNQPADQSGGAETPIQPVDPSWETTPPQEPSLPNVGKSDCDNDCKNFKDNADSLKYCQEVCGDIPVTQKNSEGDCANLAGLEKDYCFRDLAVSKKDFSVCDKISDKKLQTVCRNRVAEEVLN